MCTAITLKEEDFYFGRTLDNEFSYLEEVTVMPRNLPLELKNGETLEKHFAIIGMAYNKDGFPLYYDAVNEKGLCIAGLNFVGNAYYRKPQSNKINIAQFELIPYILGKCANVSEAEEIIKNINITDIPFSDDLPLAELHWIIADKERAVTLESTKSGINLYENLVGVLANNPEFPIHLEKLNDYRHLSAENVRNTFGGGIDLKQYSKGMGAIGLPGDFSSSSRFVRAAFVKANSVCEGDEVSKVNQFFRVIGTVEPTRGVCVTDAGYNISIYTSCCNADKGIYYYKTYDNLSINSVEMNRENLDDKTLKRYPLITKGEIARQN